MHSSKMRTVRCSSRLPRKGGCLLSLSGGDVCLAVSARHPLPVNRMTDRCKIITLPQAAGKNTYHTIISESI